MNKDLVSQLLEYFKPTFGLMSKHNRQYEVPPEVADPWIGRKMILAYQENDAPQTTHRGQI